MINVSEDYKNACNKNVISSYVVSKIGFYDKEAKGSINSVTSTNKLSICDLSKTYNNIKTSNINYITCEPNRVKLDGSFVFMKWGSNSNTDIAYWSDNVSNGNGDFSTTISIEYTFSKQISFTFLSLHFQEVCTDLDINYYLNNELVYTRQIRGNNLLSFGTYDSENPNPIQYFDKISIVFLKTKEPYRRIRFNEIDFGSYETIEKDKITELSMIKECSIDSSDLPSSSCNITIRDDKGDYDILNPNNKLRFLQERQEISLYHYLKVKNQYKEVSLGTFYLKNFNYSNRKLELECYDITYFMNQTYYESPFYINGSATKILTDIFNKMNYDSKKYNISSELDKIYLTGYIPVVDFKEALRMVAEACNAIITIDNYGVIKISKLPNNDDSAKDFQLKEISDSKPTQNLYNNVIDITEYLYSININDEKIYSKTMNKGKYIIEFTKFPIVYSLYENNFDLLKYDNGHKSKYNILSLGACACTIEVLEDNTNVELMAKIYIKEISVKRFQKDNLNSNDEYSIGKIDNKFINYLNAENLANWKLNKQEISYSFKSNIIPYLELGDKCTQEIPYKTNTGEQIKKDFVITKLELNLGIKQNVGGE